MASWVAKGGGYGGVALLEAYGTFWFLTGETSAHVTVQLRPCPYCCVANMKSVTGSPGIEARGSRLRVTGLTQAAAGRGGRGGLGLALRLVLASRSWPCSPCACCRAVAAGCP